MRFNVSTINNAPVSASVKPRCMMICWSSSSSTKVGCDFCETKRTTLTRTHDPGGVHANRVEDGVARTVARDDVNSK